MTHAFLSILFCRCKRNLPVIQVKLARLKIDNSLKNSFYVPCEPPSIPLGEF